MTGAKGRVNNQLPLVRLAVFISERDHVWCVICSEEDRQCKPSISTNENLIVVVAKQCRNSTYVNDPYYALASFQFYIRRQISATAAHKKKKWDLTKVIMKVTEPNPETKKKKKE